MKRLLSILTVIIFCHILFTGVTFGTITLSSNGWSGTTAGTWDSDTKTGTLNFDVNETIMIISDSVTLDGNGKTVTGSGTPIGVYLNNRTGVTVKNLNVRNFDYGIVLNNSNNNILSNNTAKNTKNGIYLLNSSWNNLSDNTVDSSATNGIGITLWENSNNNTIKDNTCTNNEDIGIYIYHSSNNNLTGNIISNSSHGLKIFNASNYNSITGNTVSNNYYGIQLISSSNDSITGNTVSNNEWGIHLASSSNNSITGNTVLNNNEYGIYLVSSSNNSITGNTVSNNNYGVYLESSSNNNEIYNNTVSNNFNGIYLESGSNYNKIYNNNFIDNTWHACDMNGSTFHLPKPIGGNYWSGHPSYDENGDGFVDIPYFFIFNVDGLPWVKQNGWLNQSPVADAGTDQTVFVGEEVTLDGSGSSDPDGTIDNYEWYSEDCFTDSGNPVTQTFIAEGTYTVILTVTDDYGAQATDEVTITVQTPSQAIENLIADVENLSLNKGNINALTSKLYNAVSLLEKENNNATINKLNAFINQVNAFIPQKISAEDGQALIDAANTIINQISGSLAKRGIIDKAAAQPKEYAIEQNYPNPFNPETEIHYQLPKSSHVTLKLYNFMGQEIKTLVNNYHTAGYHSVKWEGTNNLGMKVSSGVYIYIMQAGSFVEVKKLVFLQ